MGTPKLEAQKLFLRDTPLELRLAALIPTVKNAGGALSSQNGPPDDPVAYEKVCVRLFLLRRFGQSQVLAAMLGSVLGLCRKVFWDATHCVPFSVSFLINSFLLVSLDVVCVLVNIGHPRPNSWSCGPFEHQKAVIHHLPRSKLYILTSKPRTFLCAPNRRDRRLRPCCHVIMRC